MEHEESRGPGEGGEEQPAGEVQHEGEEDGSNVQDGPRPHFHGHLDQDDEDTLEANQGTKLPQSDVRVNEVTIC